MNEKNAWLRSYTYIMQMFNIDKRAELTKNNELESSIAYRIE